jgi:hypothetical protein
MGGRRAQGQWVLGDLFYLREEAAMSEPRIRITLKRNQVAHLIDACESVIEEFKYDGGLYLAEDYIELHERLTEWLHEFDRSGRRKVKP